MSLITIEQVLSLAPDGSAAQAGRGLATLRKWQALGTDEHALWGLCQGSGQNPYQVRVSLADCGSQCSCPSRKFPCKHVLGALLLYAAGEAQAADPPAFVVDWLAKRSASAGKKGERAQAKAAEPADQAAAAREAAKRERQREARMHDGLAELKGFIEDLVAGGFAHAEIREPKFWDARARRLVDAQLPGLAREVRELAGVALGAHSSQGAHFPRAAHSSLGTHSSPGAHSFQCVQSSRGTRASQGAYDWSARLLEKLSLLYLAACAYERTDALAPAQRADLRRLFGVAQRQDELGGGDVVDDVWVVLGEQREELDNLHMLRTWLYAQNSRRFALLLTFAPLAQPLASGLLPQQAVELKLAFYEASVPLRAVVIERGAIAESVQLPGATVSEALGLIAVARARDPWLHPLPMLFEAVLRDDASGDWWLVDAQGDALAFRPPNDASAWTWLATSGGRACVWFGEWHGASVLPIAAWCGAGVVAWCGQESDRARFGITS